ncbi:MAG: energy transducer TonB [Muribaculaceae bacterium]|nr:energy transducer TonB [Muribaculaceae bacterium]
MKKIIYTLIMLFSGIGMAIAAEEPTFPGGADALKQYISKNTHYPQVARDNGVEGIVSVGFIVAPDGSIKDAKIVKFVDPDLEKEALRVVTGMPAWEPAEKDGTPIEAPSKVDIPFILEE